MIAAPGTGTGTDGEFTTVPLTSSTTFTITCSGDTGLKSQPVTASVVPTAAIRNAATCASYTPLSGNTYYYCDCGTGADPDCINHIGNDANAGNDITLPRRTIGNAMTRFNTMAVNDTVALCRGGAFNTTTALSIGASRCAPGSNCNDLKDYSAIGFASTAKPIINSLGTDRAFSVMNNTGGVRILNLSLKGHGTNGGFFFYNGAHDVMMCNLDMDYFNLPLYLATQSGKAKPSNITLTGSNITNSTVMAYLGGGDNTVISYNNWEGNGSTNVFDHTIYFSSETEVTNMTVIGNYIHGQYGPKCLGNPIVGHGAFDGFQFKDNIISIDASAATGGCWGFGFGNNTGNPAPVYFKNLVVSGNTIINGGNTAMMINSAPGVIVENNVIIQNWAYNGIYGINVVRDANRGQDLDSNANVIRNNTIWFGPNANGTNTGIWTNTAGTGHIISNNTVSSMQNSGSLNCFRHDLPLASYAFINNNHCYSSSVSNRWETTRGTLAAWQAYSTARGFDLTYVGITADPMFTTAGTNFRPAGGSPLIGAGAVAPYMAPFGFNGTTVRSNPPAIGAYEFNEP
jgi:hypothetical protein